ncbi:unknown protein [Oryza sativa Japonica Group]|uniref:Os01g0539400 protein n=2 Tax=Oryza sativa subsp. japonica TaxID=39947 RepID=B9EXE0_ORYSJ|nr:hypothetical protein OsJ_02119 [Oryza sativa Japonica Group]KAB8081753.1 hypothetical protein EE612_003261 [Oryza sativa]KAB8081754.1 hypothetical protein EE612_003261 [Oryza sativa]BAD87770.1 unknown protein [Oryza sativa Japonica Group]BAF05179.1 Os01g0539400 [Oryza sativa Japonica Group]|eukprot:NP_001043265.1 Os01g0539400 [Oryza sativa Japonica Group]
MRGRELRDVVGGSGGLGTGGGGLPSPTSHAWRRHPFPDGGGHGDDDGGGWRSAAVPLSPCRYRRRAGTVGLSHGCHRLCARVQVISEITLAAAISMHG